MCLIASHSGTHSLEGFIIILCYIHKTHETELETHKSVVYIASSFLRELIMFPRACLHHVCDVCLMCTI